MAVRRWEHHRAAAELASALLRPGVDGGDVATETGLAAEVWRARTRCGGLLSATSGHGRRQWVDGVAVELLR